MCIQILFEFTLRFKLIYEIINAKRKEMKSQYLLLAGHVYNI